MSLRSFINSIADVGVKNDHAPWQSHLIRKLNLSAALGVFNVITILLIFMSIGYYSSIFECAVVLLLAPFVFIFNAKNRYIFSAYLFIFIGCFLFYFLSVKMGPDSFAFLYYFVLIIGAIQMLNRKETYMHLAVALLMCLLSVSLVIISYYFNWFSVALKPEHLFITRYLNIFFSFFTSIVFMFIISIEAIKQEAQLKTALQQKEVLLAELFHRVKNNLTIVSSLLNLKKTATSSVEAQAVIEECRNLVFSMALVHKKIYNSGNIDNLNFKEYLHDLLPELIYSIGGHESIDFEMQVPKIDLNVSQAIPCGLIVNEIITNAYKHAQIPGKKLSIKIALEEKDAFLYLQVNDNGPGKTEQNNNHERSLGMELIRSLTEQMDGEFYFVNDNGLSFNLKFKK